MERLRCESHKQYQGIKKPRTVCEACWIIYFGISTDYPVCISCQRSDRSRLDPDGCCKHLKIVEI